MPKLTAVDETYFDSAPKRYAHTWSIARPAEQVWSELTGDRPLHWCRGLDLRWTSSRPLGVGATRRGKSLGLIVVDEYFFIWDEGSRYAFYITRANVPLFTSFAEDYVVEPDGPDRCRFTWRLAVTPSAFGKPGAPINGLVVRQLFKDTGRYFNAA